MLSTFHSTLAAIEPHGYDRRPYWLLKPIVATIDAFREALELRDALHSKRPFVDE